MNMKRDLRKLSIIWDNRQNDFVIKYPRKCDGHLVSSRIIDDLLLWDFDKNSRMEPFCYKKENLIEELERRGYDKTTLKFSIELQAEVNP